MSIDTVIADLESLISKLRYIDPNICNEEYLSKVDEIPEQCYVFADDYNIFIDICSKMLEAARLLYNKYIEKTGSTDPDVERYLNQASNTLQTMYKVFSGMTVSHLHHNLVIYTMSYLYSALVVMQSKLT